MTEQGSCANETGRSGSAALPVTTVRGFCLAWAALALPCSGCSHLAAHYILTFGCNGNGLAEVCRIVGRTSVCWCRSDRRAGVYRNTQ